MKLQPPPVLAMPLYMSPHPPPQPPPAPQQQQPPPPPGPLGLLTPVERHYIHYLKRKERTQLVKVLDEDVKRAARDGHHATTPLRIQVLQSALPDAVRTQIFGDLRACASDKYVQWVRRALALPLGRIHKPAYAAMPPARAIARAEKLMDVSVAGHAEAKREVLKIVCQTTSGGTCASAYSLGLEGPPGTGKTHFVRNAMRAALDRPMIEIQLGGATDVSYLLGHVVTYEGSKEGRLAAGLIEARCTNPIFYFDEVDKISASERGREIENVLIHLIDPTANAAMRDRYFHGIDLDFSRCLFVFSYNNPLNVSPVLLDRIRRIRVETPTLEERCAIVTKHILPRVMARLNTQITLDANAIEHVVRLGDARGDGMRGCERDVDDVLAVAQLEAARAEDTTSSVVSLSLVKHLVREEKGEAANPPPMMYT